MGAKKDAEVVQIKPLEIQRAKIKIVGDTPLIVHAWSEKAKKMMLDAQMKVTKTKAKEVRDPYDDFIQSLYWLEGKPEESTVEAFEKAFRSFKTDESKYKNQTQLFGLVSTTLFAYDASKLFNETLIYYNHVFLLYLL